MKKGSIRLIALLLIAAVLTISLPVSANSNIEGHTANITSESTVSTYALTDYEGIYYFNNNYTGQYLYKTSTGASVTSGLVSSLRGLIKWQTTLLDDGSYTIQSVDDPTLYLAGGSSSSTSTIYLITLSDSSIPDRYRWTIGLASGGGCLAQNVHTGKYLYCNGSTVSSTSTLGTAGTEYYRKKAWRMADVTLYGSGSSYRYQELPAGARFNTFYLFSGNSGRPTLQDEYGDVLWGAADNFTFSGYDTNYVSLDEETGSFTALSFTSCYSTTITATHKVTGRVLNFSLIVNPNGVLVGVTNEGHDHYTALNTIKVNLTNCGYSNVNLYSGSFTVSGINAYLNLDKNNVFVSRSHGGVTAPDGTQIGTSICVAEDVWYESYQVSSSVDWSNMRLIMFVGCNTGDGGVNALNLPSVAVERGARTAVGFEEEIDCATANNWVMDLFDLLESGYSVYDACTELNSSSKYKNTTMTSVVICGYQSVKLQQ